MLDLLPHAPPDKRELAGDLVMTTMSTVGKDFSRKPRTEKEILAYADAMADMFSAYLGFLLR